VHRPYERCSGGDLIEGRAGERRIKPQPDGGVTDPRRHLHEGQRLDVDRREVRDAERGEQGRRDVRMPFLNQWLHPLMVMRGFASRAAGDRLDCEDVTVGSGVRHHAGGGTETVGERW
jgi:hypothetical protein